MRPSSAFTTADVILVAARQQSSTLGIDFITYTQTLIRQRAMWSLFYGGIGSFAEFERQIRPSGRLAVRLRE
jgi:hypothetical protein